MYFPVDHHLEPQLPAMTEVETSLSRIGLFGLGVANASLDDTVAWLCGRLDQRRPTRVAFLNAHCVNQAAVNQEYRTSLEEADAILPDGSGIAMAARLRGTPLLANLNGTDLIPALCKQLAATGGSVFLLGGRPGVAERAAATLATNNPGLVIAGTRHGYFTRAEEDGVIDLIAASKADVVLVAMGVPAQDIWLQRVAHRLNVPLSFGVGGLFDFLSGRIPRAPAPVRKLGLEWTYRLYQEPRRMWRRYILGNPAFMIRAVKDSLPGGQETLRAADLMLKRAIDIAGAAVGLIALSPLFLATACAIRATSPGPALLRQTRVGKDGKTFGLFKFRSMYVDADARRAELEQQNQHGANGVTFKLRRDPRVTAVGRVLRRSSIDELPQLWNILTGDMSLVGPRPPLPSEVARYRVRDCQRLEAKPGLTCLWQVSGRADLPFDTQLTLDIEYLRKRNVFLDLLILLRTVPAVLTARGAY